MECAERSRAAGKRRVVNARIVTSAKALAEIRLCVCWEDEMAKDREYVVVDDFGKYPDIKALKAVVQALERESAEVLRELRDEIGRRVQEMLGDAAEAGVVAGESPAAKKRGPKPKKATASEAPEGWSEADTSVELDA